MQLRVLTWNIHGARDASVERIASEIIAQRPDVVCLNEVRPRHGRRLAGALKMQSFVASSMFGPYGVAIYTNEAVSSWRRLKFEGVRRVDRRDAAVVTLAAGLTVIGIHLNLRADERLRNAHQLLKVLPDRSIVAGDMNETPKGRVWHALAGRLADAGAAVDVPTFPAGSPRERIDFIWVPPAARVLGTDVVPTRSSDHRAVDVTLEIP